MLTDTPCEYCGTLLSTDDRSCPACGAPIKEPAKVSPPPAEVGIPGLIWPPPTSKWKAFRDSFETAWQFFLGFSIVIGFYIFLTGGYVWDVLRWIFNTPRIFT